MKSFSFENAESGKVRIVFEMAKSDFDLLAKMPEHKAGFIRGLAMAEEYAQCDKLRSTSVFRKLAHRFMLRNSRAYRESLPVSLMPLCDTGFFLLLHGDPNAVLHESEKEHKSRSVQAELMA